MTDLDRAMSDLYPVMKSAHIDLNNKRMNGAYPMPLRTIKESFEALTFEKDIMNIFRNADNKVDAMAEIQSLIRTRYEQLLETGCFY